MFDSMVFVWEGDFLKLKNEQYPLSQVYFLFLHIRNKWFRIEFTFSVV